METLLDIRLSFPLTNSRDREARLEVRDEASGLMLATATLTAADLLNLMASSSAHVIGDVTNAPYRHRIGRRLIAASQMVPKEVASYKEEGKAGAWARLNAPAEIADYLDVDVAVHRTGGGRWEATYWAWGDVVDAAEFQAERHQV